MVLGVVPSGARRRVFLSFFCLSHKIASSAKKDIRKSGITMKRTTTTHVQPSLITTATSTKPERAQPPSRPTPHGKGD